LKNTFYFAAMIFFFALLFTNQNFHLGKTEFKFKNIGEIVDRTALFSNVIAKKV